MFRIRHFVPPEFSYLAVTGRTIIPTPNKSRLTACKTPIFGSGQQDVGHLGVATGRGAFNLSSSSSVGDEENPH